MTETKCERCNGTGYASAARDAGAEDLPMMLQPIGVYQCTTCRGTGILGISNATVEIIRKLLDGAVTPKGE